MNTTSPPPAPGRFALLPLTLGTFAIGTGGYAYLGAVTAIAGALGVSVVAAGQLGAVAGITRAVASPVAAVVSAGWRRDRTLLGAMTLFLVAQLGAALAPTFPILVATQAVAALAAALFTPTALGVAAGMVSEERRGGAMAMVVGGVSVAFVASVPLGTVVGGLFGWRATYGSVCAVALVALVALTAVRRLAVRADARPERPVMPKAPAVWLNLLFSMAGMASTFSLVTYIAPLLASLTRLGPSGIGGLQSLMGVGAIVGLLVGARVADRVSTSHGTVAAVFGCQSLALLSFSIAPDGGVASIVAAGASLLAGAAATFALVPLQQVRLVKIDPAARFLVLALNGSALFFGQGAGALIGGAALSTFGVRGLPFAAGSLAIGCALAAASWHRVARTAGSALNLENT